MNDGSTATRRASDRNNLLSGWLQPSQFWTTLVFLATIVFGIVLIANVQLSGDGLWFWYAVMLRGGQHLYSDLHLPLQPLIVLETAGTMKLLGRGWLASKVPAVLHVILFSLSLLLLARRSASTDRHRALMLGCAFFVSICSRLFRFDDYHVIADCCTVFSMVLLLDLQALRSKASTLGIAVLLGVLSGLAVENRLNDGGALCVGVALAMLCLMPRFRVTSLLVYSLATLMTALFLVWLTGDSVRAYASLSIFHAAEGKGGAGSVLRYPLELPWNTLKYMRAPWWIKLMLYTSISSLLYAWLIQPVFEARTRRPATWAKALGACVLIALPFHRIYQDFITNLFIDAVAAPAVFLVYGLGIYAFLRWMVTLVGGASPARSWDRREILYIIPMGQMISLATSSAGTHVGLFSPFGITLLLLIVCPPIQVTRPVPRAALVAFATILFGYTVVYKTVQPYSWHSYESAPLFKGRQWYDHPVYGPMVVDRGLLSMMKTVCSDVNRTGSHELLSIPYPYSNYFCDLPPWHRYVQTFYDTSTRETIDQLMQELQTHPPEWILYQQQPENLLIHEQYYNKGKPLPQRFLDQLIMSKLRDGSWKAVYDSPYGSIPSWSNRWILIHTHP